MPSTATYHRQQATPELSDAEILVRLYRGAERFLIRAMIGMENGQVSEAERLCTNTARIFVELLATLDRDHDDDTIAQLSEVYLFLIQHINEARGNRDSRLIADLLPIIATLRNTWQPDDHVSFTN